MRQSFIPLLEKVQGHQDPKKRARQLSWVLLVKPQDPKMGKKSKHV